MASDDWKCELNHLLDFIEKQSTKSFETINEDFLALGLPFDDEFRQNVLKMAKLRCVNSKFGIKKFRLVHNNKMSNWQ